MDSKQVIIDGWKVNLSIDDDQHLTVVIDHEDGTPVSILDADIQQGGEWADRFTTEGIELDYIHSDSDHRRSWDARMDFDAHLRASID